MGARDTTKNVAMDYVLLAAGLALAGVGLVMVLSASGIMAEQHFGNKYHFFYRQVVFAGIGLVAMLVAAVMPRGVLYGLTYFWLFAVAVLLGLTIAGPLSVTVNGASRWLSLGPVSMQPLEAAKVALVIYLAYFFSSKQEMVRTFSVGFLPPFIMTGPLCGLLLLQPDFGGAVFLAMLLFMMSLVGGTRLSYLFVSGAFAAGAAAMLIVNSPYRFRRWFAFLDPFADAQNTGYQLVQSLYAFGSGGVFGQGLGAGRQKLFFLPEAHNDFLMAVLGEETGFAGVLLVMVLFAVLLWRAFGVALTQPELRDRLTAYGMTLIIAIGFTLNLAVVLGVAPPKGVPMPFLSYGGSNLVISFVCLGILLNLSRTSDPALKRGAEKVRVAGRSAPGRTGSRLARGAA